MTNPRNQTPLIPLLVVTILLSFATAVVWNGLGFVARHAYGYPEWLTFLLFVVNGTIYALVAFNCGRILRALEQFLTPRAVVAGLLVVQGLLAPLIIVAQGAWAMWVVSIGFSLCSALLWSEIESAMSRGRNAHGLQRTIGIWNMTWMAANVVGLAGMTVFLSFNIDRWAVGVLGPVCLLAAIALAWFPATRRETTTKHATNEPPTATPPLQAHLTTCRMLLPASYLLIGVLGPLMPYRLADFDIPLNLETPLTSLWLIARLFAVAFMTINHKWHGKWSTLGIASTLLVGGFALITLSPHLLLLGLGLLLLGIGQGLVYYAGIAYVLELGRAKVDAAGTHEGLIGVGYAAGPAVAMLGVALGGGAAIGWVVLAVLGATSWPALRPWLRSRK